jgi:hypothetical protein
MNDDESTSPHGTLPSSPISDARSTPSVVGGSAAAPDPLPACSSESGRVKKNHARPRVRRIIAVATMMCSVMGLSIGLANSAPASAAQPVSGGGSHARSGPAAGGASGTIGKVSKSSFTLTTSAGQKVSINEASSTKYKKGSKSTSKSAAKEGDRVLVLGTVSSTTIKATQVIVKTTGSSRSAASTAAKVIPFQKGAPTTSKQVGQIPASYSQGSGSIVGGATANKATEAALAAYPGGIVDRVVKLSNGEFEVHNIGVNWPHHIFVNQDFKVVGAE